MKFTSRDIRENKPLRSFIRTQVRTDKAIVKDKYLFNVYDTQNVIKVLRMKIKKYEGGGNVAKYIPTWKQHIKYLENLGS